SRIEPLWTQPAQLTRMSRGPVAPKTFLIAEVLVTSSSAIVMREEISVRSSILAMLRLVATTLPPSSANRMAIARPIPCPAPVTRAFLPARRPPMLLLLNVFCVHYTLDPGFINPAAASASLRRLMAVAQAAKLDVETTVA